MFPSITFIALKMKHQLFFINIVILLCGRNYSQSQRDTLYLSLQDAIQLATDSSINAFKAKNMYLAKFWEYRTYLSDKKPHLNLETVPVNFNRAVTKEFNFNSESYEYIEQQNLNSYVNLSLDQNIGFTGGKLYIDTDLGRLQNFGTNDGIQFSSTPIRIGYRQDVFGYNSFKWKRLIEPMKFEHAKRELIEDIEIISYYAVQYFFQLTLAKKNLETAAINIANADTLLLIGKEKHKILSITGADLMTLKLDVVNSKNEFATATKEYKWAQFRLLSFLGLGENKSISVILPEINADIFLDPLKAQKIALQNNPDLLLSEQKKLEADRDFEKVNAENRLKAGLSASFGLNQRNNNLIDAYSNPLDQQYVMMNIQLPLVDWGKRKGKKNLAEQERKVALASISQDKIDIEQQIRISVDEFNLQADFVNSAKIADSISTKIYEVNKQLFLRGKIDVYTLNITLTRRIEAQKRYLTSLQNYWLYYYKLRQLLLYDIENNISLLSNFDRLINTGH